jgi:hypothetical protein
LEGGLEGMYVFLGVKGLGQCLPKSDNDGAILSSDEGAVESLRTRTRGIEGGS